MRNLQKSNGRDKFGCKTCCVDVKRIYYKFVSLSPNCNLYTAIWLMLPLTMAQGAMWYPVKGKRHTTY